ncbi:aminotransferase class V-fold PLP-dependent enzyme [Alloyangia pacifica]|uniref:Selenocysteine lyase/Cysteine desulfurase n=1 Tax=Alloyangia pacifica TaxID=311180 RepID=A0A1I6VGX2_9RHOB|nr:aminotransferase class V-fold PLP-dependent enzyme [Alloyangia pacifica]SDH97336.1 Selenocysteine lyase/Cysteine desulfurase [Alloyangia pacifica]SFT12910.1 Selenocysteine lyase/Cysteine desulfurase [Alloyangia pacifica]
MRLAPLIPPSEFPQLDPAWVHLAGGGQSPLHGSAAAAIEAFLARKADGQRGYVAHWDVAAQVRAQVARLTQARVEDVALLGNASEAITRVVSAIDWRPGDSAVMAANDYASGRAALQALAPDVQLLQVPAPDEHCPEQALIDACGPRTRLLYVSQVNPRSGQRLDIAALSAALRPRGVIVLNDATHATGALSVRAEDADVTVSSTYKFLGASFMGLLICGSKAGRALRPAGAGWYSDAAPSTAQRHEFGNVPHLDVAILGAMLERLLRLTDAAREAHLLGVADGLADALTRHGHAPLPRAGQARSQNITLFAPHAEALAEALESRGVRVWYDHGRLRLSAQLFHSDETLDRFDEALADIGTL